MCYHKTGSQAHTFDPSAPEAVISETEASLVCRASSRTAGATQRDPAFKTNKPQCCCYSTLHKICLHQNDIPTCYQQLSCGRVWPALRTVLSCLHTLSPGLWACSLVLQKPNTNTVLALPSFRRAAQSEGLAGTLRAPWHGRWAHTAEAARI